MPDRRQDDSTYHGVERRDLGHQRQRRVEEERRDAGHQRSRDEVVEDGNGVQVGWGDKWIKAKGPLAMLMLAHGFTWGTIIYKYDRAEDARRVIEAEARNEVDTIKSKQNIIIEGISNYCAAPYLQDEIARIQREYERRTKAINAQREKAGLAPIPVQPIRRE